MLIFTLIDTAFEVRRTFPLSTNEEVLVRSLSHSESQLLYRYRVETYMPYFVRDIRP